MYRPVDRPVLRLITCGGRYDADSDAYTANVVAYGTLVGDARLSCRPSIGAMPFETRTEFRTDDEDVNAYKLLTAVVVPRPIAWVTTLTDEGVVNLAPHSFYTVACANPPIVQFTSVGGKDTLRNVLATGEFVISLAHGPLIEDVNNTSAPFASHESEPAQLGITMEPSTTVEAAAGQGVAGVAGVHAAQHQRAR